MGNSEAPAKRRVLVVDDELGVLRFVSAGLGLAGYDVVTTSSGAEALQLLQKDRFDVMLLDILMEPLSGLEVLDRLRAFSRLPVIVFTAREDIGSFAMKEGANGFIGKPLKADQLDKKIREVLREATEA